MTTLKPGQALWYVPICSSGAPRAVTVETVGRKWGNLEFLVDVVTYACLIWRFGDGLHFRAVERHEVAELKAEADALAPRVLRMMRDGENDDAPPA